MTVKNDAFYIVLLGMYL